MDNLPAEFHALSDKLHFVQKVNENEWHSECPQCGGTMHQDGSFPDRFVMWRSSRRTGLPFAMCLRGHCGYKWSPSKQDANWTAEEREEFKRKQAELEAEYEMQLSAKLDKLVAKIEQDGYYKQYYEVSQRNPEVVRYWEEIRGIPAEWQRHLQKGFIGNYTVKGHLSTYQSAAYTNPVWTHGGRVENIKVRVADPHDSNDRFRNIYKSGCQHLYISQYNKTPTNKAVILEGENKCDAITIRGGLSDEYTIYGVQSKQPEARILKKLEKFEVVYIAFDPDAYEPTVYYDPHTGEEKKSPPSVMSVARQIGMERVRFVIPPRGCKFDDALSQGFKFVNAVNMAVKAVRL